MPDRTEGSAAALKSDTTANPTIGTVTEIRSSLFPESLDAWAEMGENLARELRADLLFRIGDWALFGVNEFGLTAEQAAEYAGFNPKSLQEIARVCMEIPPARRRETLSFWTHGTVAALPADVADAWLDQAEEEGWSREDLRAALNGPKEPKPIEVGTSLELVRVFQKKMTKLFSVCKVLDDGSLLLEQDGDRYRVTVEPA